MLAMVLAGGLGKRMDTLCQSRPKPMLPFAGRFRVIDFSLSNCIHSNVNNISVLVDYQRQNMSGYLREWSRVSADVASLHILAPKSGSYKGTADAVYQNIDYVEARSPDAVLVLAGDHVYRMDYRKMLAFHVEKGADVTIGVVSVPLEHAHRFGIVTIDADCRIIDFVEKPLIATSTLASMGIYIFKREILIDHLVEDSGQQFSCHDFGHTIIPQMVKENRAFAYRFNDYWQDIGTVTAYYEANMEMVCDAPSLCLNGNWPILTGNHGLRPSKIARHGNISNSLIGHGCAIRGKVENSVLSHGVIVGEQAVVRNSVVMANTVIGVHSVLEHSILDEDTNVGDFSSIGFDDGTVGGNQEVFVLGRGTIVPAYSTVYSNYSTSPEMASTACLAAAVSR